MSSSRAGGPEVRRLPGAGQGSPEPAAGEPGRGRARRWRPQAAVRRRVPAGIPLGGSRSRPAREAAAGRRVLRSSQLHGRRRDLSGQRLRRAGPDARRPRERDPAGRSGRRAVRLRGPHRQRPGGRHVGIADVPQGDRGPARGADQVRRGQGHEGFRDHRELTGLRVSEARGGTAG